MPVLCGHSEKSRRSNRSRSLFKPFVVVLSKKLRKEGGHRRNSDAGADCQLEALLCERDQLLMDFSDLAETGALAGRENG